MDELVWRLRELSKWVGTHANHRSDIAAAADRIETLTNLLAAADGTIESLRAQISRMIDPKALLRWKPYEEPDTGAALYLANLWAGECFDSGCGWQVRVADEGCLDEKATESEARAAVERAVLKALGVSDDPAPIPPAETPRTCETCRHEVLPTPCELEDKCIPWGHERWTPKTTASEEDAP